MQITQQQLEAIMPYGKKRVAVFLPFLNKYMPIYGINSTKRVCAFLAQLAHESGEFRYVEELANGKAYDTGKLATNLGNTPEADGDGQFFKGHGLIQITGKTNHLRVSKALFGDDRLLKNPKLLCEAEWAVASACWFWCDKGLNELADADQFEAITKKINGGYNGLEDRKKYWSAAKKVIR